ncbi:MAG: hypothetical protein QW438_04685 [Ignisphaera sp.]
MSDRLSEIDRYYVECPACGGRAETVLYSYSISKDDAVAILTLVCRSCGYWFRDVISLSEVDGVVCVELHIDRDSDLNTTLHLPSQVDIEVPQLNIAFEARTLRIGRIVTVEAILRYIVDVLEGICSSEPGCHREAIERLKELSSGRIGEPVTVRIKSVYSPLKVLKSYRDGVYSYC